ncbi:unnamed protein product, partial [marine sediment metagenome]
DKDTYTADIAKVEDWVFRTTDCDILAGRITYLLSCLTAVNLGPAIIAAGGIAYAGYNRTWWWATEDKPEIEKDPYEDWYAEGYLRASNELPMTLIRGGTVAQAVERCWNEYTRWVHIWETDPERANDQWAAEIIKYLLWDRDCLTALGDTSAKIIAEVGIYTAMRVEVAPPAEVDWGVPIIFSGYLEERETGARMPGKTINLLENETIIASTTTDDDGKWAFTLTPDAGEYTLYTEFPGEGEHRVSRAGRYTVRV